MGRNNIVIPEKLPFSTSLPIRITDINYGGHLGNDSFLTIAHEARVRFLHSLAYSELNFAGLGLIISDVAIDYKSEIKYGDDVTVFVGVSTIGKVHFDLIYQVYGERENKKFLAANIRTGMVVFDYDLKKIKPIPDEGLKKLEGLL
jgi:acyl-CoA thioester hydrolase